MCLLLLFVATDSISKVCHGSESPEAAAREREFFFGVQRTNTASFSECTCAVIKPHAVVDGKAGAGASNIAC